MQEEKKAFGFGVFPKILLTMLIVTIMPLAGMWYMNQEAQRDWQKNFDVRLQQTSTMLVHQVENWMDKNLRALWNNALLPGIRSMESEKQQPILKALLKTYEWSYLIHTTRLDGLNVTRTDGKYPKQYGDREYFKQVMSGEPYGHQVLMGRSSGKPAMVISVPIYAPDSNELAGSLQLGTHLSDIAEAVANVHIGKSGFALLLDRTGRMIAHGGSQRTTPLLHDLSSHPAFDEKVDGTQIVYEENGKQIVAYSQKTAHGWTVIIQQDAEQAFAPLIEAKRNATVLMGVTLLLVMIAAFVLARRLAAPIRHLTAIADSISCGDLEAQIRETRRGDEIGALARAIERMAISIKMTLQKLHKAAA